MSGEQLIVLGFVLIFFGGITAVFVFAVLQEVWVRLEDRNLFMDVEPYDEE